MSGVWCKTFYSSVSDQALLVSLTNFYLIKYVWCPGCQEVQKSDWRLERCKFGKFILLIILSLGQIETSSDPEKLVILAIYQDQPQSRKGFLLTE